MKANDAAVVFGSEDPNWLTPRPLFDPLDREFRFAVDLAADRNSYKVSTFAGPGSTIGCEDALAFSWADFWEAGSVGFFNPPYSREQGLPIDPWVEKAVHEAAAGFTSVGLIPVRPDTRWWQRYVLKSVEIRIIPHRVKFERPASWRPNDCIACTPAGLCLRHLKQSKNSAGFPTAVVVWRPQPGVIGAAPPRWLTWDYR